MSLRNRCPTRARSTALTSLRLESTICGRPRLDYQNVPQILAFRDARFYSAICGRSDLDPRGNSVRSLNVSDHLRRFCSGRAPLEAGLSVTASTHQKRLGRLRAVAPTRGSLRLTRYASSDSASRSVKHNLIVQPEPLKQGAADIAWLVASNLTDAAFPVDGIDEEFLPRIDRQVNVCVCVSPVIRTAAAPGGSRS